MDKIESLTAAQERSLIAYREECLRIGRCCEPADRPEAERVFAEMYACLSKPKPTVFWFDGPATGSMFRTRANLGANLRDNLWDNLWDNLGDNLWANLRANLRANLWANLRANLDWNFWGQHELNWVAYYDWPDRVLRSMYSPEHRKLLDLWLSLSKSCGWWQPFENIVIACERPERQAVDDRGFLHYETGPALLCRDGFPVHAWHGVRVPAKVIEAPDTITTSEIDAENNNEVKRVMIERFGWIRYLKESGARCINHRLNERDGQREGLFVAKDGTRRFVVSDPSTGRRYALGVPQEITTCEQAQAWMSHDLDALATVRT